MTTRWTTNEEHEKYIELKDLYVSRNLTIKEISHILGVSQSAVYDRILRLKIRPRPELKKGFKNQKRIVLPEYSDRLAEFVGILLGDGHLSRTQVIVSLGSKERQYVEYIVNLFTNIFGLEPKIFVRKLGYCDVYFGSVKLVSFFKKMGLVENKVRSQVGIPGWIFTKKSYQENFLRGIFDTDGSIYRIRSGWQMSFCNRSIPLLSGVRLALLRLGYKPSNLSRYNLYLTRRDNLLRFSREIGSSNHYKLKLLNGRFV